MTSTTFYVLATAAHALCPLLWFFTALRRAGRA